MNATESKLSPIVIGRARRVGQEMSSDPRIFPHLDNALQYASYLRFRNAHRAYWEQNPHFEKRYQEPIFLMADKEARRQGKSDYDSITNWDLWYHHVVHPLKSAMWEVWEKNMRLERRFYEKLLAAGRIADCDLADLTNEPPLDSHNAHAPIPLSEPSAGVLGSMTQGLMRLFHVRVNVDMTRA